MSKEAKIGLFLIVILLGGIGFVMYKKLNKNNAMLANLKKAAGIESLDQQDQTAEGDGKKKSDADTPTDADSDNAVAQHQHDGFDVPQSEPNVNPSASDNDFGHSHRRRRSSRTHGRHSARSEFGSESDNDPFSSADTARKTEQHEPNGFEDQSEQAFEQDDRHSSDFSQQDPSADQDDSHGQSRWDFSQYATQENDRNGSDQPEQTEMSRDQQGVGESQDSYNQFGDSVEDDRGAADSEDTTHDHRHDSRQQFAAENDSRDEFDSSRQSDGRDELDSQDNTFSKDDNRYGSSQDDNRYNNSQNDNRYGSSQDDNRYGSSQNDGRYGSYQAVETGQAQAGSSTVVRQPGAGVSSSGTEDNNSQYSSQYFGRSETFSKVDVANDPNVSVYVVQPHDNYWSISKQQYGTARYFAALDRYNRGRIPDPKRIRPGMKVLVPSRETLETRYPDLFGQRRAAQRSGEEGQTAAGLAPGFFYSQNSVPMYRIGAEDTLTRIAKRHLGRASRWVQIYELNHHQLNNPNDLKIGMVLRLPSDASRVNLVQNQPGIR